MLGEKPVSTGLRAPARLKRAMSRRITGGLWGPTKARLAWQLQRWNIGVQPCSGPVGSCRSPSGAECAKCPSVVRCAALSKISAMPGIIATANISAQILVGQFDITADYTPLDACRFDRQRCASAAVPLRCGRLHRPVQRSAPASRLRIPNRGLPQESEDFVMQAGMKAREIEISSSELPRAQIRSTGRRDPSGDLSNMRNRPA